MAKFQVVEVVREVGEELTFYGVPVKFTANRVRGASTQAELVIFGDTIKGLSEIKAFHKTLGEFIEAAEAL